MILMREDGKPYPHYGEYRTLEPNKCIAFTWNSPFATDTLLTIELTEDGDQTHLSLRHTGFKNQEDCDQHQEGWTACLENLGPAVLVRR